jgi:hypothetical protein
MKLLGAIVGFALEHPLWVACLAALCGLGIAWRWHGEKQSMRSRALSIMAASAPPARSAMARYLLVAAISVVTTLMVGQVSWGKGVSEPPSQQTAIPTPLAIATSNPNRIDGRELDLDALLRQGAILEIRIPTASALEATRVPTSTPTRQPTEASPSCLASTHQRTYGQNEGEVCPS